MTEAIRSSARATLGFALIVAACSSSPDEALDPAALAQAGGSGGQATTGGSGGGLPFAGAGGAIDDPSPACGLPGGSPSEGQGGYRNPHAADPVHACNGGPVLSEEEWAAASGPRPGEHAVVERGCEMTPIAQDYRVMPTVECRIAADYDFETNRLRICSLRECCTRHEECLDHPRGHCTGVKDSFCEYPGVAGGACTSDEDCQAIGGGRCAGSFGVPEATCMPTGEMVGDPSANEPPPSACYYAQEPCSTDAECTSAAGGVCRKIVRFTSCEYADCYRDADCGPSERCFCKACVPSTCSGDDECGSGQGCQLELGCNDAAAGYHCTTSDDECASSDDCPGGPCSFRDGRWQCGERCPPGPR